MLQHLLVGMLAPLCLVLGAPVTLVLRVADPATARRLVRVLASPPLRLLTDPVTALLLSTGGLHLRYLTPLYRLSTAEPVAHTWCTCTSWSAATSSRTRWPDRPGPAPAGGPTRLAVLGVAVVGHATLSPLTYAGLFVDVPVPVGRLRAGATLMYHLGDLAEILVALALLAGWRPAPTRRAGRREGTRRPARSTAVDAGPAGPRG